MKIANYLLLNFICAVFVAAIRIISYACFFDGTFFTDSNLFTFISIGIIFIPLCYSLVYNFKNRNTNYKLAKININVLAITSFVSSAAIAFSVFNMYYELFVVGDDQTKSSTMIGFSFDVPLLVLTVILLLYFVFITVLFFTKKREVLKKYKIFASIPLIWAFFFILYSYIHNNSSLLILENFFNMLIPCFVAISLIELSKLLCDLDQNKTALKRLFLFFGVSFVLNISYFVSNIVLTFSKISHNADLPLSIQIITVAITLFTTVFLFQTKFKKIYLKTDNKKEKNK